MAQSRITLVEVVDKHQSELLSEWLDHQLAADTLRTDLLDAATLREDSRRFLALFREALQHGGAAGGIAGEAWDDVRHLLDQLSRNRVRHGFTPTETATFVLSLKQPLFERLRREAETGDALVDELWTATVLLDQLGLYIMEVHQKSREEVIQRQREDMLELSTPVVRLWEGILALPLIGTLDSARTQVVMQSLLQEIVDSGAQIAIIDITGVGTVDTVVAQHLLKTVSAARLMGAECLISGIRPQIAQTIVHLGVDLADIVTKATLADAFEIALRRARLCIRPVGGSE